MRTLVVYYSLEGNTKAAAERIAKEMSADILKLEQKKEFEKKGIKAFISGGRRATFNMGVELKEYSFDVNEYDRIIIGSPVWSSSPVPAINQFFMDHPEAADLVTGIFTLSASGDNKKLIDKMAGKFKNLKADVSLGDKKYPKVSENNEEKIVHFIEQLG